HVPSQMSPSAGRVTPALALPRSFGRRGTPASQALGGPARAHVARNRSGAPLPVPTDFVNRYAAGGGLPCPTARRLLSIPRGQGIDHALPARLPSTSAEARAPSLARLPLRINYGLSAVSILALRARSWSRPRSRRRRDP